MNFEVKCPCGRSQIVSEGLAGGSLSCECGSVNEIPSLAQLRMQSGLSAVPLSPDEEIMRMIAEGELPGANCISCGCSTNEQIQMVVACEKLHETSSSTNNRWALLMGTFFDQGALVITADPLVTYHGRDTAVTLPLSICRACQRAIPKSSLENPLKRLAMFVGCLGLLATVYFIKGWFILLALALGLAVLSKATQRQQQQKLMQTLGLLPIGRALLKRYPDAELSLGQDFSPATKGHDNAPSISSLA